MLERMTKDIIMSENMDKDRCQKGWLRQMLQMMAKTDVRKDDLRQMLERMT